MNRKDRLRNTGRQQAPVRFVPSRPDSASHNDFVILAVVETRKENS